jgi:Protein of unknown function (DUF992)
MLRYGANVLALVLATATIDPAPAQRIRAGLLTCDVSAGIGFIIGSKKEMAWAAFTDTLAGPGFLAGDYIGASGEVSIAAGLGANVLLGGSNHTMALQPLSVSGQIGFNLAVGVAALHLGLPLRQR